MSSTFNVSRVTPAKPPSSASPRPGANKATVRRAVDGPDWAATLAAVVCLVQTAGLTLAWDAGDSVSRTTLELVRNGLSIVATTPEVFIETATFGEIFRELCAAVALAASAGVLASRVVWSRHARLAAAVLAAATFAGLALAIPELSGSGSLILPVLTGGLALSFAAGGDMAWQPRWRIWGIRLACVGLLVVPAVALIGTTLRGGGAVALSPKMFLDIPQLALWAWIGGASVILTAVVLLSLAPPWSAWRRTILVAVTTAVVAVAAWDSAPDGIADAFVADAGTRVPFSYGSGSGIAVPGAVLHAHPSGASRTLGRLQTDAPVTILCTAYGSVSTFTTSTGAHETRLWNWTGRGWVADAFVNTQSRDPQAPGCVENSLEPKVGERAASPAHGPFTLRDGAVVLDPTATEPVRTGRVGDLIVVACGLNVAGYGDSVRTVRGYVVPIAGLRDPGVLGELDRC